MYIVIWSLITSVYILVSVPQDRSPLNVPKFSELNGPFNSAQKLNFLKTKESQPKIVHMLASEVTLYKSHCICWIKIVLSLLGTYKKWNFISQKVWLKTFTSNKMNMKISANFIKFKVHIKIKNDYPPAYTSIFLTWVLICTRIKKAKFVLELSILS